MASEQVSTRSKSKRDIEIATNEIENEQESSSTERNDGDPGDGNQAVKSNQESGSGVTATPTNATNAETANTATTSTATTAASTSDTSKKRKTAQTKVKPSKKRAGGANTNEMPKKQDGILSEIETWYERATFGRPIDAQWTHDGRTERKSRESQERGGHGIECH